MIMYVIVATLLEIHYLLHFFFHTSSWLTISIFIFLFVCECTTHAYFITIFLRHQNIIIIFNSLFYTFQLNWKREGRTMGTHKKTVFASIMDTLKYKCRQQQSRVDPIHFFFNSESELLNMCIKIRNIVLNTTKKMGRIHIMPC